MSLPNGKYKPDLAKSNFSGKTWQTIFSGTHFSMAANRMRPAVTMPQKIAIAVDASGALALNCFFM